MYEDNPTKVYIGNPANATEAFGMMQPIRTDIRQLILAAPVDDRERAALALKVTVELMGVFSATFTALNPSYKGKPFSEVTRAITDQIIAQMESEEIQGQGKYA